MTQNNRRNFLLNYLLNESEAYKEVNIPIDEGEQKSLLRALLNVRMPAPVSDEFLQIQDEYLKEEIAKHGITDCKTLAPVDDGIYLWQGDITTLKCDAIVNAANKKMLGCFCPNHKCIDNAIHTFSGVQLRLKCNEIMTAQGCDEKTGSAKITPAYNLPSKYVIHTVGPIIYGKPAKSDCDLLKSSYRSCLELADSYNLNSIAFCCISTGEFCFPNDKAAEIAVNAVKEFKAESGSKIEVIFNVFKDKDREIYKNIFKKY